MKEGVQPTIESAPSARQSSLMASPGATWRVGSQENLLRASEAMLTAVAHERRRVVPVHEEALARVFPTRQVAAGLAISELCLADGADSMLG